MKALDKVASQEFSDRFREAICTLFASTFGRQRTDGLVSSNHQISP
jgi:hypothetical protein